MLKKVMRGIKATIHGGTKYERSVKKTLKIDDVSPKEKHLQRIVSAISDIDEETSLIKAEEIFESKLNEAREMNSWVLKLKVLLIIDIVTDQKTFWTSQDEEKLTQWVTSNFIEDRENWQLKEISKQQENSKQATKSDISTDKNIQKKQHKEAKQGGDQFEGTQKKASSKERDQIMELTNMDQINQDQQQGQQQNQTNNNQLEPAFTSFQQPSKVEGSSKSQKIQPLYSAGIITYETIDHSDQEEAGSSLVSKYSVYVREKVQIMKELRAYLSQQLSSSGTPLEEFFACLSKLEQFEEVISAGLLQSTAAIEQTKKSGVARSVVVNVFGTESTLFALILVLLALFTERCFTVGAKLSFARLIEAIGGVLKRARRLISILKNAECLGQFQLLTFKLQMSLLSSEFSSQFQAVASQPPIDASRKILATKMKQAALDFAQIALNLEQKSAFVNALKVHFQDLLSEEDPNRAFQKQQNFKEAEDPFEIYQNVYSAPLIL